MKLLHTISLSIIVAPLATVMLHNIIGGATTPKDPYELKKGTVLKLIDTNSKEGCAYTNALLYPKAKIGKKFYIVILPLDTLNGRIGCMEDKIHE